MRRWAGSAVGAGRGHPFADERVRLIGQLAEQQQVVAPEGCRRLPSVAFLVAPLERDVEDHALAGSIGPDGGFDPPEADLLDGTVGW